MDVPRVRRAGERARCRTTFPWCGEGRSGGDLGSQLSGMDVHAVRDGKDRRDPGQHQSGLPLARVAVRARAGRNLDAGVCGQLQDLGLRVDDRDGAAAVPGSDVGAPARFTRVGRRAGGRVGGPGQAIRLRSQLPKPRCRPTTRSTSNTPRALPVSRRARRSATTTFSTTATSSASCATTARSIGCASRCRSITASAW